MKQYRAIPFIDEKGNITEKYEIESNNNSPYGSWKKCLLIFTKKEAKEFINIYNNKEKEQDKVNKFNEKYIEKNTIY